MCIGKAGSELTDAFELRNGRVCLPEAFVKICEIESREHKIERSERERSVQDARMHVQSAQYQADRAFEQYDLADPKNRLVVNNLEKRLNQKLAQVQSAQRELENRKQHTPALTQQQCETLRHLSKNFSLVWNHPDTPTPLRKQLLRTAIREVVVKREGPQLIFTIHWEGDTCTSLAVRKRKTPIGSKADPSMIELVTQLAGTCTDPEIARILNMKQLPTPKNLRWTKDRVQAFRHRHHISLYKGKKDPDILTGQQARDYLEIGYHGLMALVRRGVIDTRQITDFAPWRIRRAQLDAEPVQLLVKILKAKGKLPPRAATAGESPLRQTQLFSNISTTTTKGVL